MKKLLIFAGLLLASIYASTANAQTPDKTKAVEIAHKYAKLLGISDSSICNPQLYEIIDEWMGTPYKYGGNSKKGTDCSGFVSQVMDNFTTESLPHSASGMSSIVTLKNVADLQEGDLVFFNLRNVPNRHVGIYLHNGWFVHASSYKGIGVTLSNLSEENYKRRFSKCGSIRLDKNQM